jgi:hypothetical protein
VFRLLVDVSFLGYLKPSRLLGCNIPIYSIRDMQFAGTECQEEGRPLMPCLCKIVKSTFLDDVTVNGILELSTPLRQRQELDSQQLTILKALSPL